jgi:hypothetical protein
MPESSWSLFPFLFLMPPPPLLTLLPQSLPRPQSMVLLLVVVLLLLVLLVGPGLLVELVELVDVDGSLTGRGRKREL